MKNPKEFYIIKDTETDTYITKGNGAWSSLVMTVGKIFKQHRKYSPKWNNLEQVQKAMSENFHNRYKILVFRLDGEIEVKEAMRLYAITKMKKDDRNILQRKEKWELI
jgi:hypothetical protein